MYIYSIISGDKKGMEGVETKFTAESSFSYRESWGENGPHPSPSFTALFFNLTEKSRQIFKFYIEDFLLVVWRLRFSDYYKF